ncbi:rCG20628 [Rattus norvegicus]|uniref:RCG20628 n=1 Tax=Rattus norvegicus TaxID=10116 RepID=A6JE68_RAT|nr:rCG20628 [Rattus norvegicus]
MSHKNKSKSSLPKQHVHLCTVPLTQQGLSLYTL